MVVGITVFASLLGAHGSGVTFQADAHVLQDLSEQRKRFTWPKHSDDELENEKWHPQGMNTELIVFFPLGRADRRYVLSIPLYRKDFGWTGHLSCTSFKSGVFRKEWVVDVVPMSNKEYMALDYNLPTGTLNTFFGSGL